MKKRVSLAVAVLSLLISLGCERSGVISPQERVVTQPEKRDFGLVGSWRSMPDPVFDTDRKKDIMTIETADDGVYSVKSESLDELAVSFRAVSLDDDSGYAIIDIEAQLKDELTIRYLALAKRKEDNLYVWWIESKNLAKLMHGDGHSAVIEHRLFGTVVYAEPDQLLACVRNHSRELVGKPTVLRSNAK